MLYSSWSVAERLVTAMSFESAVALQSGPLQADMADMTDIVELGRTITQTL